MSEPSRVLCTCSQCILELCEDKHGNEIPGRQVHPSTRKEHRLQDELASVSEAQGHDGPRKGKRPPASNPGEYDWRSPKKVRPSTTPGGNAQHTQVNAGLSPRIQILLFILVAWLHLCCGISQEQAQAVMLVLQVVLQLALRDPRLRLLRDVRTAMSRLALEPTITRSACCPKCFAKYALDAIPEICPRRETPRSRPCGEQLLMTRHTASGPKLVPRRLYSAQTFESWLTFFLSRPGIEDLIDKSYEHVRPEPGGKMHGIWDSPAWTSLGTYTTTKGNLTFALFIDWFNPLTNKIAGKKISYGAIMLCCLNLPPEQRYLPENMYFAGITPGPHEPSVTTVTNVLEPIIDGLADFWPGKSVCTHRHPNGRTIRVAVIPLQGDTPGLRKAGGQAGHSADQFCAFCPLRSQEIDRLDFASWPSRTGTDVRDAAFSWRAATTKKERKAIFKDTGVRWSELHRLEYRSHVRYTVLGVMHNWFEGVLQDQLRRIWGFGKTVPARDDDAAPGTDTATGAQPASHPLADEIAELLADQALHPRSPPKSTRQLADGDVQMDLGSDPGDTVYVPDDDSDSESDNDGDDDADFPMDVIDQPLGPTFDDEGIALIRACIADIILPTDIERPPTNLGDPSHGKLKADIFYTLFAVILPMCLVEHWCSSPSPRDALLLENFHDLVAATLVVGSYSVSSADADRYMYHYIKYRASKRQLFPHLRSRPNDHYAMHNGDQLKFWGPLAALSEFPYERLNGQFQGISTNSRIYEMDYTMLHQICRRGRLAALVKDGTADRSSGTSPSLASILFGNKASKADGALTPQKEAQKLAKGTRLSAEHYTLVLEYLNARGGHWVPVSDTIQPVDSRTLPLTAKHARTCTHNGRDYTTRALHKGQASIIFATANGAARYPGWIEAILEIPLDGVLRTFCIVAPHAGLSIEDAPKNPYLHFPGFQVALFYAHSYPLMVIEPHEIVSRAAIRIRPSGTFGIALPTCIVHALGRGRK